MSGLAVYAKMEGRRSDENVLQLLGFASRAGLGKHLHQQLVREVRRRYPPPITLRLGIAHCVAKLSWFYLMHEWKGDGSSGGQLQLRLEDVPRPRGRGPIGSRWNGRIGEWVEEAGSSSAPPPPRAAGAVATAVAEEEEGAAAPLASRAVDFLILALAEGPLDRDTLIENAQALGSQNKNLDVYLAQSKRERDGYITLYLDRFELTRKGTPAGEGARRPRRRRVARPRRGAQSVGLHSPRVRLVRRRGGRPIRPRFVLAELHAGVGAGHQRPPRSR